MGLAVGIDLGTSNSCVAWVGPEGPRVLADAEGNFTQPSVIAFGHGGPPVVGHRARRNLIYAPKTTVSSAKRLIGRRFSSDVVQRFAASSGFDIVEGPNGDARMRINEQTLSVPEVSAHVLRHMRTIAEEALGQTVDRAVITVPAYFNDHQRQATRDAATIAGLDCLRILNEPTAAALAYGFNKGRRQHIAVYDLGGGTFDISILRLDDDVFEVVSTSGDTFLGGDDFDYATGDYLMELFRQQTGHDLTPNRTARLKLRDAAERAKVALTDAQAVRIEVPGLMKDAHGEELSFSTTLTRGQYAQIVLPLIQRTFLTCDDAMSQARMNPRQIDHVLMVGGMTRLPLVRDAVGEFFGKNPYTGLDPDQVVAIGAAIQAHNLTTDQDLPGSVLLDVTPQSLGVRTVGGFCEVLIPRNTSIPTGATKTFNTASDNQTEVRVEVYQGESRMAADNELLGQFVLDGLRKASRGEVKVRITFEIDADGIVKVMAEDTDTGVHRDLRIEANSGLSEQEVQTLRFDQLDF